MVEKKLFTVMRLPGVAGSKLYADEAGKLCVRTGGSNPTCIFELFGLGERSYALKARRNNKFLAFEPDGAIGFYRTEPDFCSTFELNPTSCDAVFLRTPYSGYLEWDGSRFKLSPQHQTDLFSLDLYNSTDAEIEAIVVKDLETRVWNDGIHKFLADSAKQTLTKYFTDHPRDNPNATANWRWLNSDPALWQDVLKGLHDADYAIDYIDWPWSSWWPKYRNHFYHGVDHTNYEGNPYFTAMSECDKYFWRSCQRKDAYELGVSLHFFTDMSMPMHAANYSMLCDWTLNHCVYETDCESYFPEFTIPPESIEITEQDLIKYQFLVKPLGDEMALNACNLFKEHIKPKLEWPYSIWRTEKLRPVLSAILPEAQKKIAIYLIYWLSK